MKLYQFLKKICSTKNVPLIITMACKWINNRQLARNTTHTWGWKNWVLYSITRKNLCLGRGHWIKLVSKFIILLNTQTYWHSIYVLCCNSIIQLSVNLLPTDINMNNKMQFFWRLRWPQFEAKYLSMTTIDTILDSNGGTELKNME